MKKLRGENGVAFFAIQISPRQVLTFVPESRKAVHTVYNPSLRTVSNQNLTLCSADHACGFLTELWGAR